MSADQRALPRRWLMTDERLGERLWTAIARLPDGESGVVFRHYATPPEERAALARLVAETCRARGIMLAVARDCRLAQELAADFVHNPAEPCGLSVSMSVHTMADARTASSSGAALVFVSPVHATHSHAGQVPLGPARAAEMALAAGVPAIALGGMDEAAFAALPSGVFHGWAGIDAWIGEDRLRT
jgi:thiamine-phosphate pyrophosphorylase